MSSNEQFSRNTATNYDVLFTKSSYQNNWDEKSLERSSMYSKSQDDIGYMTYHQKQFARKSDDYIFGSTGRNSLPTMACYEPRFGSIEQASLSSDSVFTADSLDEAKVSDQELDDRKGCEQEDGYPVDFLDKEVFPVLLPCLEKMIFAAKEHDVLKLQKSPFNGLDYLAELLWNCNPHHPERQDSYVTIFDIPFVQEYLEKNPRPTIPQSWLWTREEAAVVIQAAFRGYLVRRQSQVQELRQFWKALGKEKLQVKESQMLLEENIKSVKSSRNEEV